ncbi:MAG: hypothetical protein GY763_07140 [Gammaproteobacteria bacterium]|nr:hypothetical protein [Gammaproteobacteria bacterium]
MNKILWTVTLTLLMLLGHGSSLADTQTAETRVCGEGETEADGCIVVTNEEEEEEPECD